MIVIYIYLYTIFIVCEFSLFFSHTKDLFLGVSHRLALLKFIESFFKTKNFFYIGIHFFVCLFVSICFKRYPELSSSPPSLFSNFVDAFIWDLFRSHIFSCGEPIEPQGIIKKTSGLCALHVRQKEKKELWFLKNENLC